MIQISGFFGLFWVIFVELGPRPRRFAELLERTLVWLLLIKSRVFEDLLVFVKVGLVNFLELLGITKPRVEHSLIVSYKSHLPCEAFVPMILWPREHVLLLLEGASVRFIPSCVIVDLWVLPQVIEERPLLMRRLVNWFKATGTVRYVRVPATPVIRVVDWLRVDEGQRLRRSLLRRHKRAYI